MIQPLRHKHRHIPLHHPLHEEHLDAVDIRRPNLKNKINICQVKFSTFVTFGKI